MEAKEPTSAIMETGNPCPPLNTNAEPLNVILPVVEDKGAVDKNVVEGEGRRGRKSIVWNHFTKLPLSETRGIHKTKCNHCRAIYCCDPIKHGTNTLNKHLHRCHKWIFTKVGKKETLHGFMPNSEKGDCLGETNVVGYNLEDCRRALAEFVIFD